MTKFYWLGVAEILFKTQEWEHELGLSLLETPLICLTIYANKGAAANDICFQMMTSVLPFFVVCPHFFTS